MVKTPIARNPPLEPETIKPIRDSESLSPLPSAAHSRRILKTRASSKYLKENVGSGQSHGLLSANSLASPFHSQHTTPATSPRPTTEGGSSRPASKSTYRSKLGTGRTRSAGSAVRRHSANRSGPNSPSISSNIHRRPSESNLHHKSKQNWLVSVEPDEVLRKKAAYRPTRLNQSFSREGSFFDSTPLACSTPLHPSQKKLTFDTPSRSPFGETSVGDEMTPRVSTLSFANDSIFVPQQDTGRLRIVGRRTTVHLPEDSIFSSALDFSTFLPDQNSTVGLSNRTRLGASAARTKEFSTCSTIAPPTSPVGSVSPASSDGGDELRDMFSILGLDGVFYFNSHLNEI